MSFILDALRKSEHERQRRAGPAIADMVVLPPRSRTPLILSVVAALLLVNLAAVAYFLLRDDAPAPLAAEPPAPAAATPATVATAPAATTVATTVATPATAAVAAPPVEHPAPPAATPQPVRPLVAEAVPAVPVSDVAPPAPDPMLLPPLPRPAPPQASQSAAGNADFVPRLDTLPPQATAGLPVLNLDLHIFSSDPAQRAVFINGRRYRAGDTLPEGVEVVAITADGAVLRHRGQRFLLARQ